MTSLSQGIERFHLVAHSLSAFFATAYAEAWPGRLETLTLASPAGVPDVPDARERLAKVPWGLKRVAVSVVASLWEGGFTPQGVVRWTGEWVGKGLLIDSYVHRRFLEAVPSKAEFAEYM